MAHAVHISVKCVYFMGYEKAGGPEWARPLGRVNVVSGEKIKCLWILHLLQLFLLHMLLMVWGRWVGNNPLHSLSELSIPIWRGWYQSRVLRRSSSSPNQSLDLNSIQILSISWQTASSMELSFLNKGGGSEFDVNLGTDVST